MRIQKEPKILVIGALGQIGRVLVSELIQKHGSKAVLATDLKESADDLDCPYQKLDATDKTAWNLLSSRYEFEEVYNLVAVLSAKGEQMPWKSWAINMTAFENVVETAKTWKNCKVFFPSSIAAYGPPLPQKADETTVLFPTTSYGISKAAGEMWAHYANTKLGLDIRCLRLPGVIGYQTMPGGGTTDYAVDIYHKAVAGEPFECYLKADTRLPMIYMDDVIKGILDLMEKPKSTFANKEGLPAVFNLNGFSVTPEELATEIKRHIPTFKINYKPDFRQQIAEDWPQELDGKRAAAVWNWKPKYGLQETTEDMLTALFKRVNITSKLTK